MVRGPTLLVCAFLFGCGDSADPAPDVDTASPDTADTTADTSTAWPELPSGSQRLVTDPYTLDAGEEVYLCWVFDGPPNPGGLAVLPGIVSVDNHPGRLVHHVTLHRVESQLPAGKIDCDAVMETAGLAFWAAATGENDLTLPDGVAFAVPNPISWVVQYHLVNIYIEPKTEQSALDLHFDDGLTPKEPAGPFTIGQFHIAIPPGAVGHTQTTTCRMTKDLEVFSVLPHMHRLGTRMLLEYGDTRESLAPIWSIDPWNFDDQESAALRLSIKAGQWVRSTCWWDNPRTTSVGFGESSDDEMCFMTLFGWPVTTLEGCFFSAF